MNTNRYGLKTWCVWWHLAASKGLSSNRNEKYLSYLCRYYLSISNEIHNCFHHNLKQTKVNISTSGLHNNLMNLLQQAKTLSEIKSASNTFKSSKPDANAILERLP